MQAIITVIVIQAAVNVFLIWSNKRKGNEDFYLIALMSLFLIHTAFKYVLLLIYHDSEIFNKLHGSFSLLYGPFLWQYFCSVTGKNLSFRIRFVHTLPFLFAFLMNLKILYEVMFFQAVTSLDEYHTLMVPLILISMISYSIFMLVKCQGLYKSKVVDIRLKAKIIVSVCGVMLIPVVLFPVNLVFKNDDFNDRYVWYGSLLIMFVVILNYRFKLQTMYRENDPDKSEGKKYQSSALSGSQLNVIIGRLNEVMNQDKFFLDSDLSLEILSESTGIPKHHITEALNTSLQLNFYRFVNQYRVNEAKHLIEKGMKEKNLIEIGFESGFKSKSTFNKYFKEITGMSPSDYLENHHMAGLEH